MDRERAVVSDVQISFMDNIATPVYSLLSTIFPEAQEILDRVKGRFLVWHMEILRGKSCVNLKMHEPYQNLLPLQTNPRTLAAHRHRLER